MTASKCIFCGAKATILCDHWIGWERKRGAMAAEAPNLITCPEWGVPLRYRIRHTCDAPLCEVCAVPAGTYHARLRHYGSVHDSIDYCPGHGRGDLRTEITGLQADAFRARWRAQARQNRERAAPASPQFGMFTGLLT